MLFELPPAARELQSAARSVAETAIAPRAADIDRTEAYPWDNVAALRDAGLLGYTIPRQYGGAGGSFLDAVVINVSHRHASCISTRCMFSGLKFFALRRS
jgi:alkylation response protein AidB-like acyl-CoA dehydrogenase